MGGGRAPCCDKSKVKRGPWSPAEDIRLINFIHKNGHPNWRSLPKQAGLLRCGKSCRLRWINYLRPDVKRGNFTPEEEDTIIKLHTCLGNRWSKIASHLPGRTDNEIKNVWNTKLKKSSSGCKGNKNGNEISQEAEGSSSSPAASSSSCSNGEQDTSHAHQHKQQHSSISETNKDLLSSSSLSSSSCSNTNSSPGTDEEMVGHISDQGQEAVDNSMYDNNPQDKEGGGDGILEIPILEECDIDIWGILDDLEKDGLPLVQSTNNDQELGGADDYTKWLKFFENGLELSQETATTAAADQQIEPSCGNLGDFPLWPNLSPQHNFGF